jgi:hypothetical protein
VDVVYQSIPVPEATRLATVGLLIAQKFCGELPVGVAGLLTITDTASRVGDSQLPNV